MTPSTCPGCGSPRTAPVSSGYCPRCAGRLLLGSTEALDAEIPPGRIAALRMGEYELGPELGRGAMGVVYRARQPSLKRDVAVKVILASRFAGDAAKKRFLAEAELAAQLDHPNIVPIYEVGETTDGPFYSMKLVEGGTLAGRNSNLNSRISNPQVAALVAKIARAVHHAHERGVLHRDLKPGNILIDAQGEPHISDFGLARRLEPGATLTETGTALGTPAYMSPEQVVGERGITTAADVWSLGAMLFHLLAGRPPFTGESVAEVLLQVRTREAPSLSALNPAVPRDLETICLKCLEKDPARRYRSALGFAEDLERWSRGEPILARPVSASEKIRLWCRRHPAIAGLSAAVVLLLLIVAIGSPIAALRIAQERNTAEAATGKAQAELRKSLEAQARSGRLSQERGFRQKGLAAIAAAAKIRPSLELRNEALAHLVSFDMDEEDWKVPLTPYEFVFQTAPDLGRYMVITNNDVSIRQWSNHAELSRWRPIPTDTAMFRILPDPRLVLIASNANFVIWDNESRQSLYRRPFQVGNPLSYHGCHDFSPDGRWAAWLNVNSTRGPPEWEVVVLSLNPFQELARIQTGVSARSDKFTRGQRIKLNAAAKQVAFLMGRVIEVRDWETGELREKMENDVVWMDMDWQQDVLAARDWRGVVHVRNMRTRESMLIPTRHRGDLLLSPDGELLVYYDSQDASTSIFSPRTGQPLLTAAAKRPCAFDRNTAALGYVDDAFGAGLWHLARPPGFRLALADAEVTQLDFSPDGEWLAAVSRGALQVLSVADGQTLATQPGEFVSCRFLADGKTVLTSRGGADTTNSIMLWPLNPVEGGTSRGLRLGPSLPVRLPGSNGVYLTSLSPDRRWLAASIDSSRGQSVVVDLENPERAVRIRNGSSKLPGLSPDHRLLTTPERILDTSNGKTVHRFTNSEAHSAAFSPDGRWMAAATPRGFQAYRVETWELAARFPTNQSRRVPGPSYFPRCVFSPDSQLLVVASEDRLRIEVFETGQWQNVATLTSPEREPINWFEFSSRGVLAVATERGLIQLWDLPVLRRELRGLGLDWHDDRSIAGR